MPILYQTGFEQAAQFQPSRQWKHPVPLGLVHGRWLDEVSVTPSKSDDKAVVGRVWFLPDDGEAYPVIVLRHGPDDAANNASVWRYRAFLSAVGLGFPPKGSIRVGDEQMLREHLSGRETWLNVRDIVDKNGYTFHKVSPVQPSDVCLGADGSFVLRGAARG
jgi:hypothetical protein